VSYTTQELETTLDILYNMFSYIYILDAPNLMVISDLFDHTDHPCQLKLVEFTSYLETLVFNRAYSNAYWRKNDESVLFVHPFLVDE
jgi:hypothetical protein